MSARISARYRSAFTLVEMLIAMALTMILVYAIAEFYVYVGSTVRDGRALIDLNGQMRVATTRLAADLEQRTLPMVEPWTDDGAAQGYFTIREGVGSDSDVNGNSILDLTEDGDSNGVPDFTQNNVTTLIGDTDDFLAFTIRSAAEPLVGQAVGANLTQGTLLTDALGEPITTPLTSSTAEVAWWTTFTDANGDFNYNVGEPRFLQRRQMIIRPDLNQIYSGDSNYSGPYFVRVNGTNVAELYYTLLQYSDVSVRPLGVINGFTYFTANSLVDLTRRENRFMHIGGGANFPNPLDLNPNYYGDVSQNRSQSPVNNGSQWRWVLDGQRAGEERMLSSLLAFDVRVFDPTAPTRANNADPDGTLTPGDLTDNANGTVQPGDPGWPLAVTNSYPFIGLGAYVDLYYLRYATGTSTFSAQPRSVGTAAQQTAYANLLGATYDTWALSYERDGLNQDFPADGVANINTAPFDEGTDGLDNDGASGVDDPGERETSPPYPDPLRGIQIRIRMYEPGTRQVRQATVATDFMPE
ncbi:MAG: prepilin-type N-terminal cleavage/methylation domain-containing protein [Pirellulaceae bacterium]